METGKVTFFSRTKNRLWTKGEESGNFLNVVSIKEDCDKDTLLIQVNPVGPVCHTGTDTCWGEKNEEPVMFLKLLQDFIDRRHEEMPEKSYTTSLFQSGINRDRSHQRHRRPSDLRRFRSDLSPDCIVDFQRIPHRRSGTRIADKT